MTDLSATPEIPDKEPLPMQFVEIVYRLRHRTGNRHDCKCYECRAIKQVCGLAREAIAMKASRTSESVPREELTK